MKKTNSLQNFNILYTASVPNSVHHKKKKNTIIFKPLLGLETMNVILTFYTSGTLLVLSEMVPCKLSVNTKYFLCELDALFLLPSKMSLRFTLESLCD